MLRTSLRRLTWSALLVPALACEGDGTAPRLPRCTAAGAAVTLAVGQYVALDPGPDSGCVVFAANGSATDSAEYVLVPQAATGEPGSQSTFSLRGDTVAPAPLAQLAAATAPAAERFHAFLRGTERARAYGPRPTGPGAEILRGAGPPAPAPPPAIGDVREFSVLSNIDRLTFTKVTATARAVGTHIAIYVDNAAPAGGLDSLDLDSLKTVFDTRLYAVDTTAFGRESDVDGNGVVTVLMTAAVNKLVTKARCEAEDSFIAGFFFGADIDPDFASDTRFNRAEMFYSVVADPGATLSCAHSRTQVKRLVPITFVHEFQHMISYNQHVLVRNGDPEVLWLNEGLSHLAEELGGRSYLPAEPARFSDFAIGNLFNAYRYLDSTGGHFLMPTEGVGSIAERGANWLFVRYIVDRFGTGLTRRLVETSLSGAANVAAQTGTDFTTLVTRWALANWVSDLVVPGLTVPADLKYSSWQFRTTYASLHAQDAGNFPKPFPLTPTASAGAATQLAGILHAGSGAYHRALQPPSGAGFTLLFGTAEPPFWFGPTGVAPLPAAIVPRLNVMRIR